MINLLLAVIYLSFISLGLPDGLLGAAWPTMYKQFDVPVSWSGIIFTIISAGTIVSSLQSDRLTRKLGTGKVTMLSVATTALALFGFATCDSFWMLCLWAIPYGLGAGSVDASLNNYVALHYESKHMSWLHCMWGIGATTGPYIMGALLSSGHVWNKGYSTIGIVQIVLTLVIMFSLPLWKSRASVNDGGNVDDKPLKLKDIFKIKGAKEVMLMFFCYCSLEQTAGLWASSYLVLNRGIDENTAATFASLFFLGITVGRALSGFLTMIFDNHTMIRIGCAIIGLGTVMILLPLSDVLVLAGFVIVGLGCAPVYPCIIHSTPEHFGADKSQAMVGVQMASAYVGTCIMPPLFGAIADWINISLLPVYLLAILIIMIVMHEMACKKTSSLVH